MNIPYLSQQKKPQTLQGFTLIEIMVSLAIFAVVAVIAVGAFLKIIDANKQSQSLQTAMNSTNFALESMVRELRVGTKYYCYNADNVTSGSLRLGSGPLSIQTCSFPGPSAHNGIAFYSSIKPPGGTCNLIHAYQFFTDSYGSTTLEKAEQPAVASDVNCSYPLTSADFVPLVSSDLNIQAFSLQVDCGGSIQGGTGCPTTAAQPKAFILIKAFAGPTERERTYFTVQTTASERTMRNP